MPANCPCLGQPSGQPLATTSTQCAIELKAQNRHPDSSAAAGSVNTHAAAMLRIVDICSPLLSAAMVPATPELSTWVVLTGSPNRSAARIVAIATNSAE